MFEQYFKNKDLDIRKKAAGFSRFMDQKVTPDVLTFIADCIINYLGGKDSKSSFTVIDIWKFPYFIKNSVAVFGKPSPTNKNANSEYDKFIAQPLKALSYAGIIREKKIGRRNTYTVSNMSLLELIAQNERNSFKFIEEYVEKVLGDSGFISKLDSFKDKCLSKKVAVSDFIKLKNDFKSFMRGYTNINTDVEINRIFPKIINPYAVEHQIRGTEKGYLTTGRFVYADLMYNRKNFRDIGKEKETTRQEALKAVNEKPSIVNYRVQKAIGTIRRHHKSSEVKDSLSKGMATNVHHIFPESKFPQISDYLENLILLTPQQHYTRAHPKNNTNVVDLDYQKECLLSKIDSIDASINKGESLYVRERLVHVINIGYGLNLSTSTSFEELKGAIKINKA